MTGKSLKLTDLGILDLGKNFIGHTAATRISETINLARIAERAGIGRYWLAEHHVPTSAYSAPEVVTAVLAAATAHIHLGHAGVILRYYSPLKIAEVFLTLEAAFPGRIDLGLCRGPGVVENKVALDLVWGNIKELDYNTLDEKVDELISLFRRSPSSVKRVSEGPFPVDGVPPMTWLLGSSEQSAERAIRNHLSYGIMMFGAQVAELGPSLAKYYRARAVTAGFAPTTAIAVSVLCGTSEIQLHKREAELRTQNMGHLIVGSPGRCAEALADLVSRCAADVLLVATFSDRLEDHCALIECLRDLAAI